MVYCTVVEGCNTAGFVAFLVEIAVNYGKILYKTAFTYDTEQTAVILNGNVQAHYRIAFAVKDSAEGLVIRSDRKSPFAVLRNNYIVFKPYIYILVAIVVILQVLSKLTKILICADA